ncbi:sensor histidine kinase [Rheinheimera sp. EpRS3]|uniref:sensor histidine kinase n=1 Tax=Rheinheimera sp. EpRS3 TaxID=1712383 RepID=UPI0007483DD1|nr:sensor histidine kinase [Rheinheimera sp. EpRS3]KUM51903.1 histidine kinase [Rheinheimera sp. EpRS3]
MKRPKKLETRLILWVTGLCLLQLLVFGSIVYALLAENLHQQTGERALTLANAVASRPDVQRALLQQRADASLLNTVEQLRQHTGADFIVIGDTAQLRLVHPDSSKIGLPMVGDDSLRALSGERYISEAIGSLGLSIRGKVPVLSDSGAIIGLVSVGYLEQSIKPLLYSHGLQLLLLGLLLVALSIFSSIWISRRVRHAIFGLQPDEIGRLFAEQEAILNTVRSGIIAVDPDGRIRKLNQRACEILELAPARHNGKLSLDEVLPDHSAYLLADQHLPIRGFELFAAGKRIVMGRSVLQVQGQTDGVLLSMRPVDELEYLSQQLAKLQEFAELLRVQTHDYANKLNTLGALIQMGAYDKAIELIGQESQGFQAQIHNLLEHISEPLIAGLLLGKHHKAREMNIRFEVSSDSQLALIERKDMPELVSILGNLIDNALEAAQHAVRFRAPAVRVTLDDVGTNLIFDVEDSGFGLAADLDTIFTPQYSSKNDARHGIGMYLVKTHLDACHGTLEVGKSDLGGARLSVFIPKHGRQNA